MSEWKSQRLHKRAMRSLEHAIVAGYSKNETRRKKLLKQAKLFELRAIEETSNLEAKAFLSKSAGALAFHTGELDLAEKLALVARDYGPVSADAKELLEKIETARKGTVPYPAGEKRSPDFGPRPVVLGGGGLVERTIEWLRDSLEENAPVFFRASLVALFATLVLHLLLHFQIGIAVIAAVVVLLISIILK